MKAQILTAYSRLEYRDVPTPSPAANEVLVRVHACGICGSDIHGWDGSTGRRRPPLIMGHEASGEIAAVGPDVSGWTIGERVTFDSTIYCGICQYCRDGSPNLCNERRVVGVSPSEYSQHGAFAEFVAVPARILHRLPAKMSFVQAAFAEPTAVALHAVRRAGNVTGSSAVVIGAGMIGLLVVQALRWAGAKTIIAIDRAAGRLDLARELGATHSLNSADPVLEVKVQEITAGLGANCSFEVVGISPTLVLALQCLRRGGRCVAVGNLAPATKDFPLQALVTRELTLLGSCASAGEYPIALDLLHRGVVRTEPLTSAVAPLADAGTWFQTLSGPLSGNYLKVILTP
ncbi:MAG TPA: galactitol-1-phosphate 5-dehydrogenase [Lacunisphaera sp.]|jgi:L-iditol 2-dehydrogenase|nr:galactitol-1-phosphate 5-dehydrogenase [Lacunisphaera sp.]